MHPLIADLFKKKGIKLEEQDDASMAKFKQWESILTGGEVTIEKLKTFCKVQLDRIENEWGSVDNKTLKNDRLFQQHTVYKTILKAIEAPDQERKQLEAYLQDLIRQ